MLYFITRVIRSWTMNNDNWKVCEFLVNKRPNGSFQLDRYSCILMIMTKNIMFRLHSGKTHVLHLVERNNLFFNNIIIK